MFLEDMKQVAVNEESVPQALLAQLRT